MSDLPVLNSISEPLFIFFSPSFPLRRGSERGVVKFSWQSVWNHHSSVTNNTYNVSLCWPFLLRQAFGLPPYCTLICFPQSFQYFLFFSETAFSSFPFPSSTIIDLSVLCSFTTYLFPFLPFFQDLPWLGCYLPQPVLLCPVLLAEIPWPAFFCHYKFINSFQFWYLH